MKSCPLLEMRVILRGLTREDLNGLCGFAKVCTHYDEEELSDKLFISNYSTKLPFNF